MADILDFWSENKIYEGLRMFCPCITGEKRKYNGNAIKVTRAHEPHDVLWENLGYSFAEVMTKRFVTAILSIILLGFCAGILFGISIGQVISL